MNRWSLPVNPQSGDLSRYGKGLVYCLAGVAVLLVLFTLLGSYSVHPVTVEATTVDEVPAGTDAYDLARFPADSAVRIAAERAFASGSASVETTRQAIRENEVPVDGFYVVHENQVVKVTLETS